MNHTDWDTIILGQGLAGSLLAWNLIQRGQRVLILDQAHQSSASRIAAGLINPVTGKRLVKQKNTNAFLAAALSQYTHLKDQFNVTFFHSKPMMRLFKTENERTVYTKRINDPDYQKYLGNDFSTSSNPLINNPYGGFNQDHTGYLDITVLLDNLKHYFIKHDCYLNRDIEYSQIIPGNRTISVGDLHANRIIFCEGYRATSNPWFNWLPFKLAKGEILTLTTKSTLPDTIINTGKWLLPIDKHTCKFGATYQWHDLNEQVTQEAKTELLSAINHLFKNDLSFKITKQEAGIRPCTKDTSPYIGLHPQLPSLGFFNGFGSRGSLLIPYYAQHFCEHLLHHQPLDQGVDITRYWNTDA